MSFHKRPKVGRAVFHENNTTISFLRADHRTFNKTNESYEGSTMLSEGSSISRFPTFNFSLDHVTSLSSLMSAVGNRNLQFVKVNLLVSILEVDGPVYVTSKNKNNPEEMALLKLIIGDDGGQICKLIVWRETAEIWSGLSSNNSTLRRGDVVYFESRSRRECNSKSNDGFDRYRFQQRCYTTRRFFN